jgi:flagellar basal-body rod protein FlgB
MTQGIEGITNAALSLALDAATMRQEAIAANIANADVPDYQPMTVDFESQLQGARTALGEGRALSPADLSGVVPRFAPDAALQPAGQAPKVALDLQMAALARNGVQYQVLTTALNKQFALMSLAINDGKK